MSTNESVIILPDEIAQSLVDTGELVMLSSLAPLCVKCYLIYLKQTKSTRLGQFIEVFKQRVKKINSPNKFANKNV